eukprot:115634_1
MKAFGVFPSRIRSSNYNSVTYKSIRQLANKVAIVTGAASGIGRSTAKLFHAQKAQIIGVDINQHGLESLKNELGNDNIETYNVDVTDNAQVKSYIDAIFDKYGKINILCNIAGGVCRNDALAPFHLRNIEYSKGTIDMNLFSVMYHCHNVIGHMLSTIENGNAETCSIINLSSVCGSFALPHATDYVISKHGVDGLTKSIAAEYTASGIRCNSVKPGFVKTPLVTSADDILEKEYGERSFEKLAVKLCAQERLAHPDEIANLCLFLASDQSSFMSGSMLNIDGGSTAAAIQHLPSMIATKIQEL